MLVEQRCLDHHRVEPKKRKKYLLVWWDLRTNKWKKKACHFEGGRNRFYEKRRASPVVTLYMLRVENSKAYGDICTDSQGSSLEYVSPGFRSKVEESYAFFEKTLRNKGLSTATRRLVHRPMSHPSTPSQPGTMQLPNRGWASVTDPRGLNSGTPGIHTGTVWITSTSSRSEGPSYSGPEETTLRRRHTCPLTARDRPTMHPTDRPTFHTGDGLLPRKDDDTTKFVNCEEEETRPTHRPSSIPALPSLTEKRSGTNPDGLNLWIPDALAQCSSSNTVDDWKAIDCNFSNDEASSAKTSAANDSECVGRIVSGLPSGQTMSDTTNIQGCLYLARSLSDPRGIIKMQDGISGYLAQGSYSDATSSLQRTNDGDVIPGTYDYSGEGADQH